MVSQVKLSICIAHKHTPENDKALAIALDCIVRNTLCDYELLIDTTTPAEPYHVYNALAKKASGEYVVFSNSDVFFAQRWDEPMLYAADKYTIVTGVLVECGAIGVNAENVERNFGMTPDTFQRDEFEAWAKGAGEWGGDGWYFPCLMPRQTFIQAGMFDTSRGGFPNPLDIWFWEKWRGMGLKVKRVRSFAYHLQNYSNEKEQSKPVRKSA